MCIIAVIKYSVKYIFYSKVIEIIININYIYGGKAAQKDCRLDPQQFTPSETIFFNLLNLLKMAFKKFEKNNTIKDANKKGYKETQDGSFKNPKGDSLKFSQSGGSVTFNNKKYTEPSDLKNGGF